MRNGADLDESRCFSVVYNGRKNSLDLQTMDESPHAAQDWYRGLKYLIESLKMRHDLNSFLHDKFKQADTDNSRSLNFRETWQLMRSLNIHLPREQVSFHYCLCSVTVTRFDRFFHSLLKWLLKLFDRLKRSSTCPIRNRNWRMVSTCSTLKSSANSTVCWESDPNYLPSLTCTTRVTTDSCRYPNWPTSCETTRKWRRISSTSRWASANCQPWINWNEWSIVWKRFWHVAGAPVDGGIRNDASSDVTGRFHFDDDFRAFQYRERRAPRRQSGHEPSTVALLHQFFAQHLPGR